MPDVLWIGSVGLSAFLGCLCPGALLLAMLIWIAVDGSPPRASGR